MASKGLIKRVRQLQQKKYRVQHSQFVVEGRKAIIQGEAYYDTLTVELLQHYAQDAGKSEDEILSITEPEYNFLFEANGVIIQE